MDAPVIELGKYPTTLAKPRNIAVFAIASHPAILQLVIKMAEYQELCEGIDDEDAPDPGPDVVAAMGDASGMVVRCAALALCWPKQKKWPGRHRPRNWKLRTPIEEYGADIYDELIDAGADPKALSDAGFAAMWWVHSHAPKAKDVEAAGNLSEAPAEG